MVGGVLSVTVKVAVQVDSLPAPSMTCSVTVVTPRPTRVPEAGVWVITSGAEPLQSLATAALGMWGGGVAGVQLCALLFLVAQVVIVGGVLSVTVKVAA